MSNAPIRGQKDVRIDASTKPISTIVNQIFIRIKPHFPEMSKTQIYTYIADRLSEIEGQIPAWTWRYVQGLHSGSISSSSKIAQAAGIYLDWLTDAPSPDTIFPDLVQVRAISGSVTPGACIEFKSRTCKFVSCSIQFIPDVPWQKYCPIHKRR